MSTTLHLLVHLRPSCSPISFLSLSVRFFSASPSTLAHAQAVSPVCLLVYRLYLYPRFLSPLRHLPGPPLGSVIAGQFGYMLSNEAGIPQRQWVKDYGPVVRVVGPVGVERMILASREALHKILVSDWGSYPRVSLGFPTHSIVRTHGAQPRFMQYVLGSVAGYGLLTVEGKDHRQMKRAMNPAFGLQHLVPRTHKVPSGMHPADAPYRGRDVLRAYRGVCGPASRLFQ